MYCRINQPLHKEQETVCRMHTDLFLPSKVTSSDLLHRQGDCLDGGGSKHL